jgi:hypothetical protein
MAYNYRCSIRRTCGARLSLNQPIDHYVKRPMCPSCGRDTLKSVNRKEKERSAGRVCTCRGGNWPHNKGRIESADRTCIYADPEKVQEMSFHEEIGVKGSYDVTGQECPF